MCNQLGQEPVEEEIPLDLEDFDQLTQTCFQIYHYLPDIWDTMGGNYLGKDYNIVFRLLELYGIELADQILALDILSMMDSVRASLVREKR